MGLGKSVSHCVGGIEESTGESSVVKRLRMVGANDGEMEGFCGSRIFAVTQIN